MGLWLARRALENCVPLVSPHAPQPAHLLPVLAGPGMGMPCGWDREPSIPAESSEEARRLPATVGKDGHLGCHQHF